MWDFSVGRSIGLVGKTLPFVIFRMIVYFGIAVAYVLVTGTGAGVGWGVGAFGDTDFQVTSTFWGGAIGFALTAGVLYFLREYILYIVKAGHIAVLTELIDGNSIPDGRGQIEYASTVVKERFAEASVLFAIDQLVRGVIGAIMGIVQGIASILPIPGAPECHGDRQGVSADCGRADRRGDSRLFDPHTLDQPMGFCPDGAGALRSELQDHAQKRRLAHVFTYGLAFLVFLVMLAPAAAVAYLIPGGWSAGGFVFALIFAWAVKAAVIEPFAIAAMLQVYFKAIEGQVPDPEWASRIEGASNKFRKLGEKAASWGSNGPAAQPSV